MKRAKLSKSVSSSCSSSSSSSEEELIIETTGNESDESNEVHKPYPMKYFHKKSKRISSRNETGIMKQTVDETLTICEACNPNVPTLTSIASFGSPVPQTFPQLVPQAMTFPIVSPYPQHMQVSGMQQPPQMIGLQSSPVTMTTPIITQDFIQGQAPAETETGPACPICFLVDVNLMSTTCGHLICVDCFRILPGQFRFRCPTCRKYVIRLFCHRLYI